MYKNKTVAVIIAAAGSGMRMGSGIPKQYMEIGGKPILTRAIEAFENNAFIDHIYVVVHPDYADYCQSQILDRFSFEKVKAVVEGGKERQDSVYRALEALEEEVDFVLVHDGARPFVEEHTINLLLETTSAHGAGVVCVPVKDTIKVAEAQVVVDTPDRKTLYSIQTPQGFSKDLLTAAYEKAFAENYYGTDDAVLVEKLGQKVYLVKGEYHNIKITTREDLVLGETMVSENKERNREMLDFRTGIGYDVHQLVPDHKLILGGVEIPFEKGLLGHSDADVLTHAIMDALLGAAALGDIGRHFPDKDPTYKGISSIRLLEHVRTLLADRGYRIGNIDAVVIAERPKVAPYIDQMIGHIAGALNIENHRINIKGTTSEQLGFCGRGEGIAAQASVLIKKEM